MKIRIGTRTSKLALSQVAEVHLLLSDHFPDLQIEIVPITTSGDKIQDKSLADIGGKGLFIKELEEALLQNKIDVAIHSAKDVPPLIHPETEIAAFTPRLDSRDCFISNKFASIEKMPKGAVIGTSSSRRKSILLRLRPDLKIVNFRGNVDTRLRKLEEGLVDATILAFCGLARLGKEGLITKTFEKTEMLPAGGQGALALQIRKSSTELADLLKKINDEKTMIAVKCERGFLRELGASCSTPVGVHAEIENENLILKTELLSHDGSKFFKTNSSGKIELKDAIELGIAAAKKVKKEAGELLQICLEKS
ncbi:MAG: hydroxymethylbilane synthase [Proteobacteria bacterium]|nr:hydroxymethylbilane synthase [Pseudomonadota bacterium]